MPRATRSAKQSAPSKRSPRHPRSPKRAATQTILGRSNAPPRRRAPKRQGRRAQLTVPTEVWERAEEMADLAGTTPNDVLAMLALKGMRVAEHELEVARTTTARVSAYRAIDGDGGDAQELPDLEELVEASMLLRRESAE